MTDVCTHGDEAEIAEAKTIIDVECMMGEAGVKCFVVMAAEAPLGRRVSIAVGVLAPEGAESDNLSSLSSASKITGPTTTPSLRLLSPSTGLSLTLTTGRSGRRGSPRKMASSTGTVGC